MSEVKKLQGILLSGDVNLEMYKYLISRIPKLDETNPIEIILNTEGGDFYQALAIYDKLKSLRKRQVVNITCEGPVMSSGITILQAATNRYMMPNSFLMIHYGEDGQDSVQCKKHNTELERKYRDIISERATVGSRTIYNWLTKDYFFNAEHALRVGLIDRIIV